MNEPRWLLRYRTAAAYFGGSYESRAAAERALRLARMFKGPLVDGSVEISRLV